MPERTTPQGHEILSESICLHLLLLLAKDQIHVKHEVNYLECSLRSIFNFHQKKKHFNFSHNNGHFYTIDSTTMKPLISDRSSWDIRLFSWVDDWISSFSQQIMEVISSSMWQTATVQLLSVQTSIIDPWSLHSLTICHHFCLRTINSARTDCVPRHYNRPSGQ